MTHQQEDRIIGRIIVGIGVLLSIVALTIMNDIKTSETELKEPTQVFIWNDDIESVPIQGYVKVDTIVNDTIYLSPDE
jgi:predicted ATP-grasp superfamily ATP-dependent carboligase